MEKEKSKPEEKTEKNYQSMIKPNEIIENNEEIHAKISQFCLCVRIFFKCFFLIFYEEFGFLWGSNKKY